MTKLSRFLFVILCLCVIKQSKAQISFSIEEPYNQNGISTPDNVITDSIIYPAIRIISSTYEIASVQAVAEDSVNNMVYDNVWGYFRGKLNISAYSQGVKRQLKFIVRDVLGNEKIDSLGYTYAKKPTSKIIQPITFTNGYPTMPIKISVTGVDTLKVRILVYFNSPTANTVFLDTVYIPAGIFDTVINVNNTLFGYGRVEVNAWDRFGQGNAYNSMDVFAHNNPFFTPYYTFDGRIADFNYNKILAGKNNKLYYIDSSRNIIELPDSYYQFTPGGKLTMYGALYGGKDWTPDSIYNDGGQSAQVSGKYKMNAWSYMVGGSDVAAINLVNMETRTTTLIYSGGIFSTGPVSTLGPNGTVIYAANESAPLIKYKDGITTTIGAANTGNNYYPITDGDYVVYPKFDNTSFTYKLYLNNGVMDTVLSSGTFEPPPVMNYPIAPPSNYLVVNKLVAYTKADIAGQTQIWLRDSLGNNTKVTFFGTGSAITALTPAGDLMFTHADGGVGKLYYLKRGTHTKRSWPAWYWKYYLQGFVVVYNTREVYL